MARQGVGLAEIHDAHAGEIVNHLLIRQGLAPVGIDPKRTAIGQFRGAAKVTGTEQNKEP